MDRSVTFLAMHAAIPLVRTDCTAVGIGTDCTAVTLSRSQGTWWCKRIFRAVTFPRQLSPTQIQPATIIRICRPTTKACLAIVLVVLGRSHWVAEVMAGVDVHNLSASVLQAMCLASVARFRHRPGKGLKYTRMTLY
ncbi:hypothetical protein BDZ89DRAFT_646994 [Hymenopellis radicata]|nr:hypothetical protein BDZ89DRAFT_646994 [Hymenopellis radicata]